MAAGNALLAMAGPIGLSIAGATLLTSILLFASKRAKLNKQKNEEIESVKRNTEKLREIDAQIGAILSETIQIRTGCNDSYAKCLPLYGKDYAGFSNEQKESLGAFCNTKLKLLLEHDKMNNTSYADTLYAYLTNERNVAATAKALFMHRNTLVYRLKKINELVDIDYDDFSERQHIILSYELYRK